MKISAAGQCFASLVISCAIVLLHLVESNCLSDMIQVLIFSFFFASTLIAFLFSCLHFILKILKGMDQTQEGIFTWSFLDVLELLDGYESSFGLYHG